MANMEELMALFGSTQAPGAEDPRRRRGAGVAGGDSLFSQFMPLISGLGGYDYSGPGRGLAGMLMADEIGPSARHFQRMGAVPPGLAGRDEPPPGLAGRDQLPPGLAGRDQLPPGIDNRNPLGGPNVAPGNIDSGQAMYQPQGRALGYSQVPHTQGWLNVAPGYAVAAAQGFGTDGGRGQGFQQQGPGAEGGVRGGGAGGPGKGVSGAPSAAPQGGGGGGAVASSGIRSAAPGGPAGGGGGGKPGGGGKGVPGRPGNATRQNQKQADRATVRAGTASPGTNVGPKQVAKTNPKGGTKGINKKTGGPQTKAGQAVVFGPGVNGPIVQTAPSSGQGGKGVSGAARGAVHEEMKSQAPPPKPTAGKTKPTAAAKARRDPRQR